MNQMLSLFLSKLDLESVRRGGLTFDCLPGSIFVDAPARWAKGVDRTDDNQVRLSINILKNGGMWCSVYTDFHQTLDISPIYGVTNATIESIEEFIKGANIDPNSPKVKAADAEWVKRVRGEMS